MAWLGGLSSTLPGNAADQPKESKSEFARQNLVAWCIVPFDAKGRSPSDRAEMVKRLGLTKVAYDWRAQHVPTFEEEILEYKKRDLEFFAFWDWHESLPALIAKHQIKPQIWKTCPSPEKRSEEEMVKAAAESLLPLVQKTGELGLKFGLYNHGGWGGELENLVKVCRYLREHHDAEHVGIVYNFHHGHGHIEDFRQAMESMRPYLLCVNVNGMADPKTLKEQPATKILPIGTGHHELSMIRILKHSGYRGPIGILDHRPEQDAEESLRQNLDGLEKVLRRLDDN
jgi:hypothetical protein